MATSIPFSAHLIYHDMCRGNDIPGVAACYKMVCPFSRFIHHFLMAMPEGEISRKFRSAFWSLPILVVTSSMSHITRIFKRKKKRKAAK